MKTQQAVQNSRCGNGYGTMPGAHDCSAYTWTPAIISIPLGDIHGVARGVHVQERFRLFGADEFMTLQNSYRGVWGVSH